MDCKATEEAVTTSLDYLQKRGKVFKMGGYYSLRNDAEMVIRRQRGNNKADKLCKTARCIAKWLYLVPFVRAIGISGSLSKHFADKDSDIDFFIITESNRLWIARTLMHAFKKLSYLMNRQHWFCMNYYISPPAMVISEKNIFTATEVVTLLPVCGKDSFHRFCRDNAWAFTYFPNRHSGLSQEMTKDNNSSLKWILEKGISAVMGNWLDDYWMRLTGKRWQQKASRNLKNRKGDPMALKIGKDFARPAPEFFQKTILDNYNRKLQEAGLLDDAVHLDC